MTAGWVAGSVRARALSRRRIGAARARALARAADLNAALIDLEQTPYHRGAHRGQTLAEAQHGVAATLLWHYRVLAGWLPQSGTELVRVISGGFEIANVDELLQRLGGQPTEPEFRLGALATAWPRLAGATSVGELRALLAASPWGDPGAESSAAVRTGMRLAWAARVCGVASEALPWAAAGAALLVARERFANPEDDARGAPAPTLDRSRSLLGPRALEAATLQAFIEALPATAAWAFHSVEQPGDLWRAEGRWWARVEHDGFALLARSGFSPRPVLGALVVLAADAWRLRAALELAARGGQYAEVLDALA